MMNWLIPYFTNHLTCHSITGTLEIWSIGLGLASVSGLSLLPKPPARITAFMIVIICSCCLYKMLPHRCKLEDIGLHVYVLLLLHCWSESIEIWICVCIV